MLDDEKYTNLSGNEYFLYMLLLNRSNISKRNLKHFSDKNGVFIYYTNEQITKHLKCNKETACTILRRLESVGLIRKEYQKRGLPLKIYVNDVFGVHNRTYNKAIPQDKPIKNYNSYKSPTYKKNNEKEVSFDIDLAKETELQNLYNFAEKKKRRTDSYSPTK